MKNAFLLLLVLLASCKTEKASITPVVQSITESVYASGLIKSNNQYQVFATVSGIVDQVFVDEGAMVNSGNPILFIASDAQQLMANNSKLAVEFNALHVNRGKLDEARSLVALTKSKLQSDLAMLERHRKLWAQNIGSKVTLEQKELAYKSAAANYTSAKEGLQVLKRQLKYSATQSENNLLISNKTLSEYLVKSKINGKVYQLNVAKGELVTPQLEIAIIGDASNFLLEMQVDEYDIVAIKLGMPVLVVLNSYKDSVFTAAVSKINPIMNLQSKTFTIEAEFVDPPEVLYPNISFEANVLIHTKEGALLIPRNYLLNDSIVMTKAGKRVIVTTGLKDYQMIEILSGITATDELIEPTL